MKTRKPSVRKHIKIGSVIQGKHSDFWEVVGLKDKTFVCVPITPISQFMEDWDDEYYFEQEFYYNIDMVVYEEVARNIIK